MSQVTAVGQIVVLSGGDGKVLRVFSSSRLVGPAAAGCISATPSNQQGWLRGKLGPCTPGLPKAAARYSSSKCLHQWWLLC